MRVALGFGVIVVAVLAALWGFQRRLIYFPFAEVPDPRAVGLPNATAVAFTTADEVTLNGWFVPADGTARMTFIVFNGNAGNRAFRAPLARALAREGIAVLLFDYRGFGGNPGSPTEEGLRADARAARSHVVARAGDQSKRIVYFGESLGSAVAAELAVEHPPAALILRSPFTSLTDIARLHYGFLPVGWLLRDRFATIDRIAQVRTPLLVVAGDRDRVVPAADSLRLFDAASEPKSILIIPDADHNDAALTDGKPLIDGMLRFLDANVN